MRYTKILAIISGGFIFVSAIGKVVQMWKPVFGAGFTFWTSLVGFLLGGYCILWLVLQATKENWKIAFPKQNTEVQNGRK